MNHTDTYLTLTNTDPMTRLPLFSSVGAHEMLRNAANHGTAVAVGYLGKQVTVTSSDGVFFNISA